MLSVKQGNTKYHLLSFWYDSTWDWTPVSRTIGEHFNYFPNGPVEDDLIVSNETLYNKNRYY